MKRFFSVFLVVCIILGNQASYHITAEAARQADENLSMTMATVQEIETEETVQETDNAQTEQGTEEAAQGAALSLASPSAILLEASTGGVIYEQDADSRRSPASITKIMTLLLIFENLEQGKIHLEDQVTTSAHAKSMGGSQVFLEEGEVQTVDTLIKCIAVASGNDASVAMAEYIAGSEEEFVRMMNEKASQLGMENTHFADCCGLTASDDHYTTARDIAIMSRALITSYPKIFDYTKIWMEDITHVTKQGTKTFTLSSTNKLLKQYPYATGLKTGSTSKAKYCLSATASKDGIDMIAVIMAAPDYKVRFQDASKLLEYGYAVSSLYTDENQEKLSNLMVTGGVVDEVALRIEEPFRYLDIRGNDLSAVTKKIRLPETAEAPVAKGETAGKVVYELNGKEIGSVRILFDTDIAKAVYKDYVKRVFIKFF